MTLKPLSIFVPFAKVDEEKRLVYGMATGEERDIAGEVCDYASTKPYYEKWSNQFAKNTDGESYGNVRTMHGKVAAGKLTSISFDDDAKQILVCAKIVDDAEWNKVLQKVYTGFSQGGGYVRRWKDPDDPTITRYTANPTEISLVDNPCLPSATFEFVKIGGVSEMRNLSDKTPTPTNAEVAARATEMAKAAGDETKWAQHVEAAHAELTKAAPVEPIEPVAPAAPAPVEPAKTEPVADPVEKSAPAADGAPIAPTVEPYEQVWLSKSDGATFKKKADLIAHINGLEAAASVEKSAGPAVAAIAALSAKLGIEPVEPAAKVEKVLVVETDGAILAKSLYTASRAANAVESLKDLLTSVEYEAAYGKDGKTGGAKQLKTAILACYDALVVLVDEAVPKFKSDEATLEAAAGVPAGIFGALKKYVEETPALSGCLPVMEKLGARNSKGDAANLQAAHDALVKAGAMCGGMDKSAGGDLAKMTSALEKVVAERDGLAKVLEGVPAQMEAVAKRLEHLEKQPVTLPLTGVRVLTKGQDVGGDAKDADSDAAMIAKLEKMSPEAIQLLMIKTAQANPIKRF